MNFAFTEEQELLRETARRFLDDKAPSEVVRKLMESHEGMTLLTGQRSQKWAGNQWRSRRNMEEPDTAWPRRWS